MQNETNNAELKGFMEAIIQSNTHLVRTIILVLAIFAAVCLGFVFTLRSMNYLSDSGNHVKVSMLKSGIQIEVENPDKKEKSYSVSQFLLPSNDIWYDTGIEIEPGEECEFKISGKVNLSLNKLVESARIDQPPKVNWCTPDGNDFSKLGETQQQDQAKRSLLLYPGDYKKIGNVVCYLQPSDDVANFQKIFLENRRAMTSKIQPVGSEKKIPNETKSKLHVFLAVNDILFDFSDSAATATSEAAYFGKAKEPMYKDTWEHSIKSNKYVQLWYDDNVGCFLVSVTIRKKDS